MDFRELFEQHRRELHVHCYRMLASFTDADDAVQETFLRAWRHRDDFEPGTNARAWLYRIATNACLDAIRRGNRRPPSASTEVSWLEPYPDHLLDQVAPADERPDAVVVARETIELAYLTAIQLLPARQRAVLLMRDVLDWSAAETAELLELSVPAANSALQRARATLRSAPHRDPAGDQARAEPTGDELELLQRLIDAHERADVDAAVALLREDVRVTMPPLPLQYTGLAEFLPLLHRASGPPSMGQWRLVPTRANRMPAAASYLREPGGTEFRAFKLDVVRCAGGRVAEFTTFDAKLFPLFGLPGVLRESELR
ncbi:RNA polymerase subunit sigma-70 [Dactylosporangium sp. NPDC048998]|uniref:RNA polymerase subunit sigma-70 n=1 Tax=Dactylosporangium sp. NPDC048998 TaxID=3363976 RepID=UPI0037123784